MTAFQPSRRPRRGPRGPALAAVAAFAAWTWADAAAGTATAVELQPHRANYDLRLVSSRSSSRFVDVRGASTVLLERTCDGWIAAERVTMQLATTAGENIRRDLRFTGWESSDGRRYRFVSRSVTNGRTEDFKGTAAIDAAGAGAATYSLPEGLVLDLPKGTLFYVAFTRWLLEQALAGRLHAEVLVFDGADDKGPERAVVFITPAARGDTAIAGRDLGALVTGRAWNMRMAFYSLDSRSSQPDFEVESRMFENGVATRFRIEFPSFVVVQEAQQIEAVDAPDC